MHVEAFALSLRLGWSATVGSRLGCLTWGLARSSVWAFGETPESLIRVSDGFLVGTGGMGFLGLPKGTLIGIHSPIPY